MVMIWLAKKINMVVFQRLGTPGARNSESAYDHGRSLVRRLLQLFQLMAIMILNLLRIMIMKISTVTDMLMIPILMTLKLNILKIMTQNILTTILMILHHP